MIEILVLSLTFDNLNFLADNVKSEEWLHKMSHSLTVTTLVMKNLKQMPSIHTQKLIAK